MARADTGIVCSLPLASLLVLGLSLLLSVRLSVRLSVTKFSASTCSKTAKNRYQWVHHLALVKRLCLKVMV
jgi:hypothetical protein